MSNTLDRRIFLAGSAAAGVAALASRPAHAAAANSTVTLAIMGANGRGSYLARQFSQLDGVRIAYVCDPDSRAIEKGIAACGVAKGEGPQGVKDFRVALDDPAVDALIVATPNHWHAPATIMGCAAGKHVYVEKPCSHTADEGERMIAAAHSYNRVVQVGMQRRSSQLYQRAVARIREGAIGEVLLGKSYYHSQRPSIGHGKQVAPPDWLDFDLWQGPVTDDPYRDNLVHYNWHFFWHWGNGELGNNGVHTLDICRWAMGIDFPSKVSMAAAKLRFDDDQQTPDTVTASFECGGRMLVWECIAWSRRNPARSPQVGMELRGEEGTMILNDQGYTIYDPDQKVVEEHAGGRGDVEHFNNFLDCIRSGGSPAANIEEGHKSALYCHLGNMAYRTGQSLDVDSATGRVQNSPEAEKLWGREYRPGWLPS